MQQWHNDGIANWKLMALTFSSFCMSVDVEDVHSVVDVDAYGGGSAVACHVMEKFLVCRSLSPRLYVCVCLCDEQYCLTANHNPRISCLPYLECHPPGREWERERETFLPSNSNQKPMYFAYSIALQLNAFTAIRQTARTHVHLGRWADGISLCWLNQIGIVIFALNRLRIVLSCYFHLNMVFQRSNYCHRKLSFWSFVCGWQAMTISAENVCHCHHHRHHAHQAGSVETIDVVVVVPYVKHSHVHISTIWMAENKRISHTCTVDAIHAIELIEWK